MASAEQQRGGGGGGGEIFTCWKGRLLVLRDPKAWILEQSKGYTTFLALNAAQDRRLFATKSKQTKAFGNSNSG